MKTSGWILVGLAAIAAYLAYQASTSTQPQG
jgi:hypothetical protein